MGENPGKWMLGKMSLSQGRWSAVTSISNTPSRIPSTTAQGGEEFLSSCGQWSRARCGGSRVRAGVCARVQHEARYKAVPEASLDVFMSCK